MGKELIQSVTPYEFRGRIPVITDSFAETLAVTPPWENMIVHRETTRHRFEDESRTPGFEAIVAEVDGQFAGLITYREMNVNEMEFEGMPSVKILEKFLESVQGLEDTFILFDRTFVVPKYQKEGIAGRLRVAALRKIAASHPSGVTVLTQHLEKNEHIIKSSQRLGFTPTGIGFNDSEGNLVNQYWYKRVDQNLLIHPDFSEQ